MQCRCWLCCLLQDRVDAVSVLVVLSSPGHGCYTAVLVVIFCTSLLVGSAFSGISRFIYFLIRKLMRYRYTQKYRDKFLCHSPNDVSYFQPVLLNELSSLPAVLSCCPVLNSFPAVSSCGPVLHSLTAVGGGGRCCSGWLQLPVLRFAPGVLHHVLHVSQPAGHQHNNHLRYTASQLTLHPTKISEIYIQ